jgi:hypothetical protein
LLLSASFSSALTTCVRRVRLPAIATTHLVSYLKQGGDLLAMGLPLWNEASFWLGGKWISRREYEDALAQQRPRQIIVDFERTNLAGWRRSSNAPESPVQHGLESDDTGGVLHVRADRVTGWETYASPELTHPFPAGHTLTCVRAKGGPKTRQLALEWTERDGSRWIATVDLAPTWRHYVLEPAAFKAWQSPAGRGRPGDQLRVHDAARFTVGLALSHTALDGPEHEYRFGGLGTAPNPFGDDAPPTALDVPRLESLSPGYQFFPLADVETVEWPEIGSGIPAATDPLLTRAPLTEAERSKWLGIHPRPRGVGFQQERPWRWQPVGVARSRAGDYRGAYDPEVIDRDLRRIKAMNLNAVSAFSYHRSLDAQHLLDFLLRCQRLDLRVNLSLRPGTPMDFRWPEMKALIEHYRLSQNDTVFAYDLAWEPSHYDEAYQRRYYTALWRDWVTRRYGNWSAAETAWGLSLRANSGRDAGPSNQAGEPTTPPMRWLTTDGPWRRAVADYRAFLDDLVGQRYAEARRLVQSIDPNHPVSFRTQLSGDPTHNTERLLPYDFRGLANAVDLWEPEAYGRIGDWDRVKAGIFTVADARLCDPIKPVIWAEMGYSVWDTTRLAPHPDKLRFAAGYYRDFYRMLIASGSDGVFFWWYPGGLRLNENSDYGIVNPDGTDRELTRVIRSEARAFLTAPRPLPPDHEIVVDRDQDARGLVGIYPARRASD